MTAASKTIHNPDKGFDYPAVANQYRDFVEDMAAFIRWAMENDRDEVVLTTLIHDIMGADRHGLGGTFSPRVTGYSNH